MKESTIAKDIIRMRIRSLFQGIHPHHFYEQIENRKCLGRTVI